MGIENPARSIGNEVVVSEGPKAFTSHGEHEAVTSTRFSAFSSRESMREEKDSGRTPSAPLLSFVLTSGDAVRESRVGSTEKSGQR